MTARNADALDTSPRMLLIDDNPDDRALAQRELRRGMPGVEVDEITTLESFDRALEDGHFDLAVTDYQLHWADGVNILRQLKDRYPEHPVIMFTNSGNEEVAVAAMKAGADDYVIKSQKTAGRLATAVRLARERATLRASEREALQLRDAFLAVAAHELNTPVTTLLGFTQLFRRRLASWQGVTERDRRGLETMERQVATLRRLIETMLDISRLDGGGLEIERVPIDLRDLARQVVDDTEPLLTVHTIDLTCPDAPLIVIGDALRLRQAIHSLVGNAVKYSPAGGPITVSVARRGDQATVTVADQGIGIPEGARGRLFERFYRAANVNPLWISGFGVGLYIVAEVVARHRGTIDVQSVEGQGSQFTVSLPLASVA